MPVHLVDHLPAALASLESLGQRLWRWAATLCGRADATQRYGSFNLVLKSGVVVVHYVIRWRDEQVASVELRHDAAPALAPQAGTLLQEMSRPLSEDEMLKEFDLSELDA
jgi:hypothetical protein